MYIHIYIYLKVIAAMLSMDLVSTLEASVLIDMVKVIFHIFCKFIVFSRWAVLLYL
jgi:hypothetical protein